MCIRERMVSGPHVIHLLSRGIHQSHQTTLTRQLHINYDKKSSEDGGEQLELN